MTATIHYLGRCESSKIRELADLIDENEVTHMVCVYRKADGDLAYRLIGVKDSTYLMGMMSRVIVEMHLQAYNVE